MSTPAWWLDGLTATLMREGVSKHRAKEIAIGYWEAYCEDEAGQVEQYKQDAERYRYMRSNAEFLNRNGPGLYWYLPRWPRNGSGSDRLDRSVDAAIRAKAQGE